MNYRNEIEIELDVDDIYESLSKCEKNRLLELLKDDDKNSANRNIIDDEWYDILFNISGDKHRCMSNEDIEIIKNISKKY